MKKTSLLIMTITFAIFFTIAFIASKVIIATPGGENRCGWVSDPNPSGRGNDRDYKCNDLNDNECICGSESAEKPWNFD